MLVVLARKKQEEVSQEDEGTQHNADNDAVFTHPVRRDADPFGRGHVVQVWHVAP